MGDVSEESLLDYFYSAGGKVKNADLMKIYRPFIGHNDMQLRDKYREEFKRIIDMIAVVKSENSEKYLILKKRYRQQEQGSETEPGTDRQASPAASTARPSASVQRDVSGVSSLHTQGEPDLQPDPAKRAEARKPPQVMWCGGSPSITFKEAPKQEHTQEDQHTERTPSPSISEKTLAHSNGEDELDRDSGSKSESEEECMGRMRSTPVALIQSLQLDPVEKEWIYSATCGSLSDLSQLLKQEPSLANKKDFVSGTALHWAAKHGKEDMATMMVNAGADVNTKSHVSTSSFSTVYHTQEVISVCIFGDRPGRFVTKGGYTPLHIAALHGHRHILELLIGTYGAKKNLRDYSGHLACQYLNITEPTEDDRVAPEETQFPEFQARDHSRNRKLVSLFQSKKKWGSAEELAPVKERVALAPHQLMVPAFRPRKFSR
ncbi:ankyrin repeat domain-containing protein SOWAHC isoform X2 [Oncorhynchus tshawytscha]|uniref:ankyrin repeat domain-containing protein SOWAHC isoform X2 n=1 Tax=Oncorhynchus tshawytscha TaxID=74940 RepID=UPI001C3E4C7F|nr:ankyrin repeat domain-containing protein SOWAHC isoform X2 [Oncorhynchus tshawytscha]